MVKLFECFGVAYRSSCCRTKTFNLFVCCGWIITDFVLKLNRHSSMALFMYSHNLKFGTLEGLVLDSSLYWSQK